MPQIEVELKVDEEAISGSNESSKIAYGWVTLENLIKFPVNVRKYINKETGKPAMFVSYPQRKTGNGYEYICAPTDAEVRKQIDEKVFEKVREVLVKPTQSIPVEEARVTLLEPSGSGTVKNVGIATIKLAGMQISRIVVKEGQRGLFIQMPQYKSGNEYKDTVYAVSTQMKHEISDKVIEAYQVEKTKRLKQKETPQELEEQKTKLPQPEAKVDPYDAFLAAAAIDDREGMLKAAAEAETEITQTGLSDDDSMIEFQEAVIRKDGQPPVTLVYGNEYRPDMESSSNRVMACQLIAFVPFQEGNKLVTLAEYKGNTPEELKAGYEAVTERWNSIVKLRVTQPYHHVRPVLMAQPRR